jgi:NAD(P)-dependent dehydrogenase (short-subunit alcohol dehydrogenase family)
VDLELRHKRAIVTGGSRGIGRAIASALLAEGCDVVIAARDRARLDATAEALRQETGGTVVASVVDTGDDDSVRAMVRHARDALGGIDILVNNAARPGGGPQPPATLATITAEGLFEEVNVKVMGYLRCAREVAPAMIENGWGRIINISGLAARNAGSIVGSVRNVSVAALTKVLADELGPAGINVTVVHPGATRTEATDGALAARAAALGVDVDALEAEWAARTSVRRIITAEEVASVVTFLASPRSVAITGDAVACAGGMPGAIYY